jgi:RNA recognition motif. (a.k.a. RRM, RBD, or RNP domain)
MATLMAESFYDDYNSRVRSSSGPESLWAEGLFTFQDYEKALGNGNGSNKNGSFPRAVGGLPSSAQGTRNANISSYTDADLQPLSQVPMNGSPVIGRAATYDERDQRFERSSGMYDEPGSANSYNSPYNTGFEATGAAFPHVLNQFNDLPPGSTSDCNLYIKNIDYDVSDEELFGAFAHIGEILSHHIVRDAARRSRGFGFM